MANGLQNIETTAIEILSDLGRFTATSFWEDGPAGYLAERAKTAGLDVLIDEWGNVLATKAGSDSSAPGIAFVAHMDHPGYEVIAQNGSDITLETLGSVGIAAGREGTTIHVIVESGARIR
jgi:putative aminopeptidase FrvX